MGDASYAPGQLSQLLRKGAGAQPAAPAVAVAKGVSVGSLFSKPAKVDVLAIGRKRPRQDDSAKEAKSSARASQKKKAGEGASAELAAAASDLDSDDESDAEQQAVAPPPIKKTKPLTAAEKAKLAQQALEEKERATKEKNKRTVFVGNVPVREGLKLEKLKKQLKRLFVEFGEVESVRLRSLAIKATAVPTGSSHKVMRKVSTIKNSVETENSVCVAYVVFKSEDSVSAAVENGSELELQGNHLRVDAVDVKGKSKLVDKTLFDRRSTVFVGNMPFDATEESVRDFFESKPGIEVKSVRLIRDPIKNTGKGIGYVLLESNTMLLPALEVDGEKFLGRDIRVSRCQRSASEKGQLPPKKKGKGPAGFKNAKAPSTGRTGRGVKSFQGTVASFADAKAARQRLRKKAAGKDSGMPGSKASAKGSGKAPKGGAKAKFGKGRK